LSCQKFPKALGVIALGLSASLHTAALRSWGFLAAAATRPSLSASAAKSAVLRICLELPVLLGELDTPVLGGQSLAVKIRGVSF